MKKILIIHTKYRNLGGEDTAVVNENILLNENYEVNILYFNNKIKNLPKQFFSFLLNQNKESMNILQEKINNFNPDIAYVHNTWFKASLGIFKILKKNNIRVLLKLHNFRYDCTRYFFASSHLRGLKICPACGMNQKRGRIVNKYFEDSYLKSFLIIYYGKKYFNIIIKSDIQILVLTQYHKDYLVNLGLEESRINIFPNYLNKQSNIKPESDGDYLVYAGRISREKGVEDLLIAFSNARLENMSLKIIGGGPNLNYLKKKYKSYQIDFLGEMNNSDVINIIRNARAVVTATKLLEGQPMLLCEASILSVPAIFPKVGGISEFFPPNYALSFEHENSGDLEKKILLLLNKSPIKKIGIENNKFIENYLDNVKLIEKFEKIINE